MLHIRNDIERGDSAAVGAVGRMVMTVPVAAVDVLDGFPPLGCDHLKIDDEVYEASVAAPDVVLQADGGGVVYGNFPLL